MTPEECILQLEKLILQKDFRCVSNGIYLRIEHPICYLLAVQSVQDDITLRQDIVRQMAIQMQQKSAELNCTQTICLYLCIGTETDRMPTLLQETERMSTLHHIAWYFDLQTMQLNTAQDSPKKLLGLEKYLRMAAQGETLPQDYLPNHAVIKKPIVTWGIWSICVILLCFGMLEGTQETLLTQYCISRQTVFSLGEYYRLLTSLFFHVGWMHLAANSVYLLYFGMRSETVLGHARFLVLYLLSGLGGSLWSLLFSGYPAVGASGAIFGLLGAMLFVTKQKGAQYSGMNYATMLLLAVSALGMGFLDVGVDNWAHLGGFFTGLLFMIGMMYFPRSTKEQ